MKCFLKKNNKIMVGFSNAAIYNFNNKNVYLVNKHVASKILSDGVSELPESLLSALLNEGIITREQTEAEGEPLCFDYELFDDKYSYEKCRLAYLEITDVCNFNCMHCYADMRRDSTRFMSLADASHYVKEIASMGACDVRITGGEPFLNKAVCDIADLVAENVAPINTHSIVSNGSFDVESALYVLGLGFELQISIYGTDAEKFSRFANSSPELYERVMRNLERIAKSEYKDQVILLFSVNALTYNDIDTFKAMADRLGLRYMLNRPATVGRATENWSVLRLSAEDLAAFSKSQRPKTPFYCYHLCQLHWTSIMVNGDVTPCGFLRSDEYVLGNLKEQSLGDIWHCAKYDSFRGMCAHDVSECRECEFKFVCTAGCCGETVSFSGNILNPYSGCQLKPYENKDYLKINDDELFLVSKNAAGIFDFIKRGDFIAS